MGCALSPTVARWMRAECPSTTRAVAIPVAPAVTTSVTVTPTVVTPTAVVTPSAVTVMAVAPPPLQCQLPSGLANDQDQDWILDVDETGSTSWTDVGGDGCFDEGVDTPGGTLPDNADSDGDGIRDGCEDRNLNGQYELGELLAFHADTDCDGIDDGIEDDNQNGIYDRGVGETSPKLSDTDGDGLPDGVEDANGDGNVAPWQDIDGDGCWTQGVDISGETDPTKLDSDSDLLWDGAEDVDQSGDCNPGETCAFIDDTDCDLILDGLEDKNGDGVVNTGETDPLNADSDADGIDDGVEDANQDGFYDPILETSPILSDSDGDGLPDGLEDADGDGMVLAYDDFNTNGCWDEGETPGETDPRTPDSDGDGIWDALEDRDQDGKCDSEVRPHPLDPSCATDADCSLGQTCVAGVCEAWRVLESCGFLRDSDCDGIPDGVEDSNLNGTYEIGETDATWSDTDFDGLSDGLEDRNSNGIVDPGESDPRSPDTDLDDLTDGCESNFSSGALDPTNEDSDGDGANDGEEDENHNCVVDPGETDPNVFDAAPVPPDPDYAEWAVCATNNLKNLTFAEHNILDYRLAFEIEKAETGVACPSGLNIECDEDNGERCDVNNGNVCIKEAEYISEAFGINNAGDDFSPDDVNDTMLGHIFQSPAGVVRRAGQLIFRDVYGFVFAKEDGTPLSTQLQTLRTSLTAATDNFFSDVTDSGTTAARPAHDSVLNFRIDYADSVIKLRTPDRISALSVRNYILASATFMDGVTPDPSTVPPPLDPVYNNIVCPQASKCFEAFDLYIAAVQRQDQLGPNGLPTTIFVVALTPDESGTGGTLESLYNERLVRLQDLTGGAGLARFGAKTGKGCNNADQNFAFADVLWVVDDSRSMQQIIDKLQLAAGQARAVFASNAKIIDFRVAMTTTNPGVSALMQCPDECDEDCTGDLSDVPGGSDDCNYSTCADAAIGCVKVCPSDCTTTDCFVASVCDAGNTGDNYCNPSQGCVLLADLKAELQALAAPGAFALPGGGGTFYYEDTEYLDCDSSTSDGQTRYINQCSEPEFQSEFDSFYGPSGARVELLGHAGFLGPDVDNALNCGQFTELLDLTANAEITGSDCSVAGDCCPRLTQECEDGPTVLASQMCDLIRAMGGKGTLFSNSAGSARPHSAPEHGSRSARRLIETALPALPRLYTAGPEDPKKHLRLNCDEGDYCEACDPRAGPRIQAADGCPNGLDAQCGDPNATCVGTDCVQICDPIPLVTIFLSDEEDFWFKDDCMDAGSNPRPRFNADQSQLPDFDCAPGQDWCGCRYMDGDPTTVENCTQAYCEATSWPAGNLDGSDRTAAFRTGPPTGYDPDFAGYKRNVGQPSSNSLRWRNSSAPECSPDVVDADVSCVRDPCPEMSDETTCKAHAFTGIDGGLFGCVWTSAGTGACHNPCALVTLTQPASPSEANEQRDICTGDLDISGNVFDDHPDLAAAYTNLGGVCRWDQAYVISGGTQRDACVLKYPTNDCQPCKRLLRTIDGISGGPDAVSGANLVGFGDVGPVYAIVRDNGVQGFHVPGGGNLQDPCEGGSVTWGRGDGEGYRGLANQTFGLTQDVCAESYEGFMTQVISDIAALSAPYTLSEPPIPATIKVGIARPGTLTCMVETDNLSCDAIADCGWSVERDRCEATVPLTCRVETDMVTCDADPNCGWNTERNRCEAAGFYFIEVPRSSTQGFFYAQLPAGANVIHTVAFRSNPIDGECAAGETCPCESCTPNTPAIIQDTEIDYARNLVSVPREGDIVYISYRFWRPVPCAEGCPDGWVCARVLCVSGDIDCTPNDLIDRCVPNCNCDPCEECVAGVCQAIGDPCRCNSSSSQTCFPNNPVDDGCPPGLVCDETGCVCALPIGGCPGIDAFGRILDCDAAKLCCETWAGDLDLNNDCCLPTETVECFPNFETGQSYLECSPECICAPPDPNATVNGCNPGHTCERSPGTSTCTCLYNPQ